jgi:DnaK suppressor protein
MTLQDLEYFRNLLERQKHKLPTDRALSEDSTKPVMPDQAVFGRLSRMDALQGQAMAVETRRRTDIRLHRIHSALERMQSDDYGYCLSCGEEIGRRRLEADPAAPLCIQCASRRETR